MADSKQWQTETHLLNEVSSIGFVTFLTLLIFFTIRSNTFHHRLGWMKSFCLLISVFFFFCHTKWSSNILQRTHECNLMQMDSKLFCCLEKKLLSSLVVRQWILLYCLINLTLYSGLTAEHCLAVGLLSCRRYMIPLAQQNFCHWVNTSTSCRSARVHRGRQNQHKIKVPCRFN